MFAARLCRLSWRGILAAMGVAGIAVMALMSYDQSHTGHDHMRSAFSHGFGGLLAVARNRIPLSYLPAVHAWTYVGPFLIAFAVVAVVAVRADRRGTTGATCSSPSSSASGRPSSSTTRRPTSSSRPPRPSSRCTGPGFRFAPLRTMSIRPLRAAEAALVPNPATGDQAPGASSAPY